MNSSDIVRKVLRKIDKDNFLKLRQLSESSKSIDIALDLVEIQKPKFLRLKKNKKEFFQQVIRKKIIDNEFILSDSLEKTFLEIKKDNCDKLIKNISAHLNDYQKIKLLQLKKKEKEKIKRLKAEEEIKDILKLKMQEKIKNKIKILKLKKKDNAAVGSYNVSYTYIDKNIPTYIMKEPYFPKNNYNTYQNSPEINKNKKNLIFNKNTSATEYFHTTYTNKKKSCHKKNENSLNNSCLFNSTDKNFFEKNYKNYKTLYKTKRFASEINSSTSNLENKKVIHNKYRTLVSVNNSEAKNSNISNNSGNKNFLKIIKKKSFSKRDIYYNSLINNEFHNYNNINISMRRMTGRKDIKEKLPKNPETGYYNPSYSIIQPKIHGFLMGVKKNKAKVLDRNFYIK